MQRLRLCSPARCHPAAQSVLPALMPSRVTTVPSSWPPRRCGRRRRRGWACWSCTGRCSTWPPPSRRTSATWTERQGRGAVPGRARANLMWCGHMPWARTAAAHCAGPGCSTPRPPCAAPRPHAEQWRQSFPQRLRAHFSLSSCAGCNSGTACSIRFFLAAPLQRCRNSINDLKAHRGSTRSAGVGKTGQCWEAGKKRAHRRTCGNT